MDAKCNQVQLAREPQRGQGFAKAFREGCAKGLANQEQEQEQEQRILSNPNGFDDAAKAVFDYYLERTDRNAKTYEFTPARNQKALSRLKECLRKTGGDL